MEPASPSSRDSRREDPGPRGGLANSDYWGNQIRALAPRHKVILVDSHGRSTRDARPYGYDLMADDVVALLDVLKIPRADIVGWSDGGIIGLDLPCAIRIGPGASSPSPPIRSRVASSDGVEKNPTFAAFIKRGEGEYAVSATPNGYDAFVAQIGHMWASQPDWTDAQLKTIQTPVVADGDHDEAIKREHTEYIARTIPDAGLLIIPDTSHFAFLQDPALFNAALLNFLDER